MCLFESFSSCCFLRISKLIILKPDANPSYMQAPLEVNKPKISSPDLPVELFQLDTNIPQTIKKLEAGKAILIQASFANGLELLKELHVYLNETMPNESFQEQRLFRAAYQRLSNHVFLEIKNHQLTVKKAPSIGWLEKLYPEDSHFLLPFPQVQGLNSAWQWYEKGLAIPVLRNKLHPYYGTYFPTRFEHLEVFDNFLKRYTGPKKAAMDVGIGSGVLSFLLVQYGFQKVFATDTNANAIIGLQEFMGTTKLSRKIELDYAHLFGQWEKPCELIVFNPPWIPQSVELNKIDEAIYYPETLFPAFFAEAEKRLLPEGKLLVIFSNLAQITGVTNDHPVEEELKNNDRFQLEKCYKKSVKRASDDTKRNQDWREQEEVELWVLVPKN